MKNGISEISSDSEYGRIITEHALKTVDNFENCKCTNPDCKEFNYLSLKLACLLLEKKYGFRASIEKFDTNIGDINLSPTEIHVEWPEAEAQEIVEIKPQLGPQEEFLSTRADIAIFGGAAGGGKSHALLMDPLRNLHNKDFSGVLFRRESPMLLKPGGLWDESSKMYRALGAEKRGKLGWVFPTSDGKIDLDTRQHGMKMELGHLYEEDDKHAWQGGQIPWLGFDELTQFTKTQFFYLLSRVRSTSGVGGRVRGTCNPDPDSWVCEFIDWWLDPETGFPIKERSGVLRWFIRQGEELVWADSREELIDKYGAEELPMSVTFIPSKITDNKILLATDKTYLANLRALSRVDRARLLDGNWKIRAQAGTVFNRGWFEIVDCVPPNIVQRMRYWDRAATEPNETNPDPDWTVGLKLSRDGYGTWYIEHVERFRGRPLKVEQTIQNIAKQDTGRTLIGIEKDPWQPELRADRYIRLLAGFVVTTYPMTKDKVTRAKPASAQSEGGNVKLVRGAWNKAFLDEAEAFPDGNKDDQVDSFSGAFNAMVSGRSVLEMITR